jgi:predicted dehydrogenase
MPQPNDMARSDQLRFAMFGSGFWARYQLAAWRQVAGVECVAIYNRTRDKAEALAGEFQVPSVYNDAEQLLRDQPVDFIDVVTDGATHRHFVEMAARHRRAVICQKPLAPTLADAESMSAACRQAGVPLLVHENWRWQRPIRALREILQTGEIGEPFRARIEMISGFPVFANQPFLKDLEQFILTDLGTHILDVARFLFGEADAVYCQTRQVHSDIRGEDVATVVLNMNGGQMTVLCHLAYAGNHLERECFPETLIFIEASRGSLELAPDYWVRVTTERGTLSRRYPPVMYNWVDPAYAVVQSSIVDCHRDLVRGLKVPSQPAETTAEDNLRTLRLVFDAYASAASGQVVRRHGR